MFERFTEEARRSVFFARYEASQTGSREITTEHLLLGIMRENARLVAECFRPPASLDSFRKQIEAQFPRGESSSTSVDLPLSHSSKRALAYAADESLRLGHKHIGPQHMLIGVLREEKSLAASLLRQHEVTVDKLREKLQQSGTALGEGTRQPDSVIAETCRDLNAAVMEHAFQPLVGREREMDAIIQVLARRNGNSPVLIGEPGVGKTAIVEGLAQRIVDHQVPEFLAGKRILVLDPECFVESARNRRELRDKFAALLADAADQSGVILFIDGLFEPATRTGGPFGDVLGALLAALSFGKVQCIATGTQAGYREAVQRDPAIERHMRAVEIPPPGEKDAVQILFGVKEHYERYHAVVYDNSAIETAVLASVQFMPRRCLPEKAIDLIDEAGARVKLRHEKEPGEIAKKHKPADVSPKMVAKEDIEELVAERAGLPVQAVRDRLNRK